VPAVGSSSKGHDDGAGLVKTISTWCQYNLRADLTFVDRKRKVLAAGSIGP